MRSAQSWAEPATRLIASTIVGRPITAGDYLFWHDRRGRGAVYGYDRPHAREFVVNIWGQIRSGRVEPQPFIARAGAQLHLLRLLDDLASDRLGERVWHTA